MTAGLQEVHLLGGGQVKAHCGEINLTPPLYWRQNRVPEAR